MVRKTGSPTSFNDPAELDKGVVDQTPAMNRKMRRAETLGATAQAISKTVARRIVRR